MEAFVLVLVVLLFFFWSKDQYKFISMKFAALIISPSLNKFVMSGLSQVASAGVY